MKKIIARVIKAKIKNMVTVIVEKKKIHQKYRKYIKIRKKYIVQNNINNVRVGNKVFIRKSIPISKLKKWIVIKKIY